jgi:riboflavin kinase/FMN adenylyltransferase
MNKKGSIVTIGVFDGVHVGHQAVIKKAVKKARSYGLKSIVVTFDPHPLKVLDPRHFIPSLISLGHRIDLIKKSGIDEVFVIKFSKRTANISPERFVEDVIIGRMHAREIVVGEDFYFGKGARAGVEKLREIAEKRSVKVEIVKHVRKNSRIVSSTIIRRLVMDGRIREAEQFLGRPYSILGTVVSGTKLARELGYPTANVNPHHEAMPPSGVYAVKVRSGARTYGGVMNIGVRPTFYDHGHDKEPTIEVHIFNFHKKIYGKDLEIRFVRKIRDERRFKATDRLIEQIEKDERSAKALLR